MTKRKPHKNIDNIEYKHGYNCNKWKKLLKFNKSSSQWDKFQNKSKNAKEI